MNGLLNIDGLSGGYHSQQTIINNVSFNIERGEFLGIIGPNGSGKSTLLKFMSRVLPPAKGMITLEGSDINRMDLKVFCRQVAFVGQDTIINFSFTAEELVLMGRIPHLRRLQFETRRDISIARNSLSLTDTLELKEKFIDELSAGERQRVIIAKALAQEPILLLLDEPTSHLDIGHQIQILNLLKKLNREKNLTIVIVLHDLNLASEYCNRLILLNQGAIFQKGEAQEVLTYQNIEKVYKTLVIVEKNPISLKPHIMLFCGNKK